jgi:hypothetical protein
MVFAFVIENVTVDRLNVIFVHDGQDIDLILAVSRVEHAMHFTVIRTAGVIKRGLVAFVEDELDINVLAVERDAYARH